MESRARLGLVILAVAAGCLIVPDATRECASDSACDTEAMSTGSQGTTATSSAQPTTGSSSPDPTLASTGSEAGTSSDVSDGTASTDTTSTTMTTGAFDPDDDPTLIAWYAFESDPATGVLDSSVNQLHGTCAPGECPLLEPGVIGQAIHFDGEDDHIRAHMPFTFDTPEAWTVALWIRRDGVDETSLRMAVSRAFGSQSRNTYELYFHDWETDGPVLLYLGATTLLGTDRIAAPAEQPTEQWIHVAGTWDGQLIRLWVAGLQVASLGLASVGFDDHDLIIGADENSGGPPSNFFDGSLDDLRIYGRTLTSDEIMVLATPP